MKAVLFVACIMVATATPVFAQDVPKAELFGGYSWAGGNFHGWNSSITGNVNKWFGIVGDLSGHYGSELDGTIRISEDAHSFIVGPRISLRGKTFNTFTYAAFGATRFHQRATIAGQKLSDSDTGFSLAIGAGLDIKVSDRLAIRAFQLDYLRPTFFGEAHNRGRLAFGFVFRVGQK